MLANLLARRGDVRRYAVNPGDTLGAALLSRQGSPRRYAQGDRGVLDRMFRPATHPDSREAISLWLRAQLAAAEPGHRLLGVGHGFEPNLPHILRQIQSGGDPARFHDAMRFVHRLAPRLGANDEAYYQQIAHELHRRSGWSPDDVGHLPFAHGVWSEAADLAAMEKNNQHMMPASASMLGHARGLAGVIPHLAGQLAELQPGLERLHFPSIVRLHELMSQHAATRGNAFAYLSPFIHEQLGRREDMAGALRKGVQKPDWRPDTTVPEDYHALARRGEKVTT